MFKIERKIVEFVERNVNILFMLAITGLAIVVRYAGRDFVSGDMTWFLLGWFQKIADNGGIHSLKDQVGDYNILYQTIVAIFTYIGDKSIYYYKILSIFFDFCMAISAAIFACELSKKEKNDKVFFVTFAAVIMLPTVILNSAYWGQCDSIYTTFIILTLLYLYREKYHRAFMFLGIAFAFKMQTIFIFPFIICFYIYKKQFSIFELLITVFTFWISGIGAFVQGRSLLDPFRIYANQTGTYQYMHVNFPSFWMFVGNDYEWLKTAAIVMAAGICGMGLYIIMKRKLDCSRPENFVSIASWFIWTCVLFLPEMHERYAYPLEILLVILTCINKDYLKYSSVAILFSLFTYGNYLFSNGGLDKYIVIIYAGCYLHFTYTILKKNSKAATVTDKEMQNE